MTGSGISPQFSSSAIPPCRLWTSQLSSESILGCGRGQIPQLLCWLMQWPFSDHTPQEAGRDGEQGHCGGCCRVVHGEMAADCNIAVQAPPCCHCERYPGEIPSISIHHQHCSWHWSSRREDNEQPRQCREAGCEAGEGRQPGLSASSFFCLQDLGCSSSSSSRLWHLCKPPWPVSAPEAAVCPKQQHL